MTNDGVKKKVKKGYKVTERRKRALARLEESNTKTNSWIQDLSKPLSELERSFKGMKSDNPSYQQLDLSIIEMREKISNLKKKSDRELKEINILKERI